MKFKAGKILLNITAVALVSLFPACKNLIYDYEGNCEDAIELYLKYDYNIQRADMRADHVGYAIVYAVNEKGNIAAVQSVEGEDIHDRNYTMKFNGLQPGRYTFTAVAFQRPYQDIVNSSLKGARFRSSLPQQGAPVSDLKIKLDRDVTKTEAENVVNAPEFGLDTLWIGQNIAKQGLEILDTEKQRGRVLRDTISLVRDTKYLHLTLHQIEDRSEIKDEDFTVRIMDKNGYYAHDNSLLEDVTLTYPPFAKWTTAMSESGRTYDSEEEAAKAPVDDPIVERAAHYNISFGRLMYYAAQTGIDGARLQIVNNESEEVIVDINLAYYLAFGRDAYAVRRYTQQEYLDREYNYMMDFFLQTGKWRYVDIKINIMGWAKRIQNEIL